MNVGARSVLGTVKDSIKETLQDYAEMQDAYDEGFGIEKETYPQAVATEINEDDIDEYDSLQEVLSDTYDSLNVDDPVRFYGDALRAKDDGEVTGIMEDITEYGGGGKQGWMFGFFTVMEDYETAAALIGEDPEQVEADLAPRLEDYHTLREERYGLPETELDNEAVEHVQTVTDILAPAIEAYGNDADIVDAIHAAEGVEENVKLYAMEKVMDAAVSEAESQMEDLFDALEHELGTDQFGIEPVGTLTADDDRPQYTDATTFLAENDDAFSAYTTVREVIDAVEDEESYSEAMQDRDLAAAAEHTTYDPKEFQERFDAAEDARSNLVLGAMGVLDSEEIQNLENELDRIYGER